MIAPSVLCVAPRRYRGLLRKGFDRAAFRALAEGVGTRNVPEFTTSRLRRGSNKEQMHSRGAWGFSLTLNGPAVPLERAGKGETHRGRYPSSWNREDLSTGFPEALHFERE